MSAPTNHWKLGLFVVLGVAVSLAVFTVLGARSMKKDSVPYKFYFDESVQGLDIGSPTKFRGVTVGTVSKIDVAPDRRHVEVTSEMEVAELGRLGLIEKSGLKITILKPPDLRVQLASQGVTGVKFLLIDFYDVSAYPPPLLSFPTPENYIPTATSTLKSLEDAMARAGDRVPVVLDGLVTLIAKMNAMLVSMDVKGISEQALVTLNATNRLLASIQATIDKLDAPGISKRTKATLDDVSATLAQINGVTTKLSHEKGLLASAQRTSEALGGVARGTSAQIEDTLRGIQEAAEAIQRVAEGLERDPDMLIKGRKKAR